MEWVCLPIRDLFFESEEDVFSDDFTYEELLILVTEVALWIQSRT